MTVRELTGIILAAGFGRRMERLGARYPKVCLPVGLRSLLRYHVDFLRAVGVDQLVVVVNHLRDQVEGAARRAAEAAQLPLHLVEQPTPRGIAHALSLAREFCSGDLVVVLGDTYYWTGAPRGSVEQLRRPGGAAAVLSVRVERDPDQIRRECSARFDRRGNLLDICEKPARPWNNLKPCGIYFFSRLIFDAIDATPASALRGEVEITDAIRTLIDQGHTVHRGDAVLWDCNLNEPGDLLAANLVELARRRRNTIVAADAVVDPSARLRRVVVGAGASIEPDADVEDVVVLDGAVVRKATSLRRAIVGPDGAIEVPEVDLAALRQRFPTAGAARRESGVMG